MTSFQSTSSSQATIEHGWTKPFHSVQHFGHEDRAANHGRWATVTNWGEWAELDGWYQGCAFSPYTARLDTIEEARAAGERWVRHGVFPQQKPTVRDLCDPAWSPAA